VKPIYESYNPVTQRSTEVAEYEGGLSYVHSQNTQPIVEQCKREASNFDPLVRRDVIKVASIPLVIWNRLKKLGITNDEKALNAWLNDSDNAVFRTDDRSTL
jgi:hypothetical protein